MEVWESISIVNVKKRVARKLHQIILLHFGLVSFRFHFGETRQPIISMAFGPSGRVHDSQHQLFFIFGDTDIRQIIQENPKYLWGILFLEISKS